MGEVGTSSAAIEVHDVEMAYPAPRSFRHWGRARERLHALRGVSLVVERRGRVAVFGENGTGKTTLLKIIAGLLIPSRGRVVIGSREGPAPAPLRVGYVVTDERSFFWRLSGFENLRFFAALDDAFGTEGARRITSALDAVGLSASSRRPVGEYSPGMRQRLALARGLLQDPDVLLLDEPTRSLDPAASDSLLDLVRATLGSERTLLMATNRFEDAIALCDAAVVLRGGRVAARTELSNRASESSLVSFVRTHLAAEPMVDQP